MSGKVCITGGTGLIGTSLRDHLASKEYSIRVLSRKSRSLENAQVFQWDIQEATMDQSALSGVDAVVHLAGANLADKRWTDKRKKFIRNSRENSTRLLYDTLSDMDKKPEVFISASAVGIYGHDTGGIEMEESRANLGDDFLASVCKEWEEEARKIEELGIRVVILRFGMVLSMKDGALPKMVTPVKFGMGAPLGSGEQYYSWIHIDDLCRMIMHVMENDQVKGTFNAVAPEPETNKDFMKKIAKVLHRPFFMPNVPSFLIYLVFGELASTVVGGQKVSDDKIRSTGFEFEFNTLEKALIDLLERKN